MTGPARLMTAAIASLVASLVTCEVVRRIALRRALLDAPNERSLHTVPTPRLGGIAIVVVTLTASLIAWDSTSREVRVVVGLCAGIALVGLRDDLRPMSARARLAIQVAVSVALLWLLGTPTMSIAPDVTLPVPSSVVGVLLVVWMVGVLNIYNFMDGMDGLAACQTISGAAALAVVLGVGTSMSSLAVSLAASSVGFLALNFPPARIFMGDAGSTFIGLAFAALAVVGMHHGIPITVSALPITPFLLDGTFTIIRRALRKEKIWTAHRSHLYQRAVQTGLGHRDVLLVYVVWMGVAAAGAVLASSMGTAALAAAWLTSLLGLGLVWRWVVHRESTRSAA